MQFAPPTTSLRPYSSSPLTQQANGNGGSSQQMAARRYHQNTAPQPAPFLLWRSLKEQGATWRGRNKMCRQSNQPTAIPCLEKYVGNYRCSTTMLLEKHGHSFWELTEQIPQQHRSHSTQHQQCYARLPCFAEKDGHH